MFGRLFLCCHYASWHQSSCAWIVQGCVQSVNTWDHGVVALQDWTIPCSCERDDSCSGLELHVVKLVPSQCWRVEGGHCGCTGRVLIILCCLFAGHCLVPKWTSVSTVTVTNGYASLTTAALNDPHSSSKSQLLSLTHIHTLAHTHIPSSTLPYRNCAQYFHSACFFIKDGREEEEGGRKTLRELSFMHKKKQSPPPSSNPHPFSPNLWIS